MNEIILTGVGLLIAHLLTDFMFQTKNMIRDKRAKGWKSPALLIHAALAGFLAILLSGQWEYWATIGLITAGSHWIIDSMKLQKKQNGSLRLFLLDQCAHILIVIFLLFYLYPQLGILLLLNQDLLTDLAIYTLGLILIYRPAGFLIEHAVKRWDDIITEQTDTLPEAGRWIGYLERLLIFIFMMMGQYSAIGFLIAAKSILRFRDSTAQRQTTEYILVGTLLSFTIAIIISLGIRLLSDAS